MFGYFRKLVSKQEPNSGEVLVQKTALRLPADESIRRVIRQEFFRMQVNAQAESFEEADDFEMDDEQWQSPYEEVFEPEAEPDTGAGRSPAETAPASSTANPEAKNEPPQPPNPESGT